MVFDPAGSFDHVMHVRFRCRVSCNMSETDVLMLVSGKNRWWGKMERLICQKAGRKERSAPFLSSHKIVHPSPNSPCRDVNALVWRHKTKACDQTCNDPSQGCMHRDPNRRRDTGAAKLHDCATNLPNKDKTQQPSSTSCLFPSF